MMVATVALWIAAELLKFVAGQLFQDQLKAIFESWDWQIRQVVLPRPVDIQKAMEMAVVARTGSPPTPAQSAVLTLLYDPAKAAAAK